MHNAGTVEHLETILADFLESHKLQIDQRVANIRHEMLAEYYRVKKAVDEIFCKYPEGTLVSNMDQEDKDLLIEYRRALQAK